MFICIVMYWLFRPTGHVESFAVVEKLVMSEFFFTQSGLCFFVASQVMHIFSVSVNLCMYIIYRLIHMYMCTTKLVQQEQKSNTVIKKAVVRKIHTWGTSKCDCNALLLFLSGRGFDSLRRSKLARLIINPGSNLQGHTAYIYCQRGVL
jgi:hypothetical protein